MHYCTQNNDVSLSKKFQQHLCNKYHKHGVIDQGKYRKKSSKIKRIDKEYHVQGNADVAHK